MNMSHKLLNLRDGAFSISSFPLLLIRRQLRQPRGQDGSNLHKSLFQVGSIFLGRTATRKVRMVRPVGEIDGHKGLGKVVLDARDRPTVVETVGEQNVRGTASRQVVNVPALHQLVRLRRDAEARLAVLRQPLEGPGTVGKHAAGGAVEANGFDAERAGLEIPAFPRQARSDPAPVARTNGRVGSRRQLLVHVEARVAVVVGQGVDQELAQSFQRTDVVVVVVREKGFASLVESRLIRWRIVRHVEVGKRVAYHHEELV